jgi:uncharacterized membrane protein
LHKGRLEAFSDGVLAIIITVLVLELKIPHGIELSALRSTVPALVSYVLSFVYIGIYWNNHHHLFQAATHVTGGVLWANLHLLFWLSLIPFVTAWLGENDFAAIPVAFYGLDLLLCGLAYYVLELTLIRAQGPESRVKSAVGRDIKGLVSLALYVAGISLAWFSLHWVAAALYAVVALMWLIPDRRIENALRLNHAHGPASAAGHADDRLH